MASTTCALPVRADFKSEILSRKHSAKQSQLRCLGCNFWAKHSEIKLLSTGAIKSVHGNVRKSCVVRAASGEKAEAVQTASAEAERADLKAKLKEDLLKTSGNLTDVSVELIAALEKLNPSPAPTANKNDYVGDYIMLNSTMQGVLYKGATVTTGRMTFNTLQPTDLKTTMEDVYNYVGLESDNAYNVEILFTVAEEGLPPVQGSLLNRAEFQVSSPQRLDVLFKSSTLAPKNPEKDLQDWLKIFKEANPEMDDQGVLKKDLPPATGWIDVTYVDDDLRISRGNFGTIVVVERLK